MMCPRLCPTISAHLDDPDVIRQHLLDGARCVDAWLSLAELVRDPRHRLDCLERAAALDPENTDLQIIVLEQRVALDPADSASLGRLRELQAARSLRSYRARVMMRREPPRPIGRIMVDMKAITDIELSGALREQRRRYQPGAGVPLGDLLIEMKLITPAVLARALIIQQEERIECGMAPSLLGEYLISEGHIGLRDLELALAEQIRLRQLGQRISIGKLLLQRGAIQWPVIHHALERQQNDSLQAFI